MWWKAIYPISGGSFEYNDCVTKHGAPRGPSSPEGYSTWPQDFVQRLLQASPQSGGRFAKLLQGGLFAHTDCSGRMTPECTLITMLVGFQQCGISMDLSTLNFWRGCDTCPLSQNLMTTTSPVRPQHVFKSLAHKLPQKHVAAIQRLRPNPKAPLDVRREAYSRQKEYIYKLRGKVLHGGMRAPAGACLLHPGEECPATWPRVAEGVRDDEVVEEVSHPVTMAVVGLPCTPFTSIGNNEGLGHPAIETVNLGLAELSASDFDMVFLENSKLFPASLFEEAMGPTYKIITVTFGPEHLGWPIRRTRSLRIAINTERLVWIGGSDDARIEQEFMSIFGKASLLDASHFVGVGDATNVKMLRTEFAKKMGFSAQLKGWRCQTSLCLATATATTSTWR